MSSISVVMPTYNCAHLVRGALESVRWADEVVVVDQFSDDGTPDVCRDFPNVRVIQREAPGGNFDLNRDHAVELARSEWILKLDSDERFSEGLQREIREIVASGGAGHAIYRFPPWDYQFGKVLRWGSHKLSGSDIRLWRRGAVICDRTSLHQPYVLAEAPVPTRAHYHHYNYSSIRHWYSKFNRYTDTDARLRSGGAGEPPLGILRLLIAHVREFWNLYLRLRGYRDGAHGLLDAYLRSQYGFLVAIKMRECGGAGEGETSRAIDEINAATEERMRTGVEAGRRAPRMYLAFARFGMGFLLRLLLRPTSRGLIRTYLGANAALIARAKLWEARYKLARGIGLGETVDHLRITDEGEVEVVGRAPTSDPH